VGCVQQHEIRRAVLDREEVQRPKRDGNTGKEKNTEQMYDWIENPDLDKKDKGVQNLMHAAQNWARHVKKHEKNPDYKAFRHLNKILVEHGHKLKIKPKHLSYNSLHYNLKK
jgi:hypothetical protein